MERPFQSLPAEGREIPRHDNSQGDRHEEDPRHSRPQRDHGHVDVYCVSGDEPRIGMPGGKGLNPGDGIRQEPIVIIEEEDEVGVGLLGELGPHKGDHAALGAKENPCALGGVPPHDRLRLRGRAVAQDEVLPFIARLGEHASDRIIQVVGPGDRSYDRDPFDRALLLLVS